MLKNKLAFKTLFAGFLVHVITNTFHTWPSISRYFNSYLIEKNSSEISKVYLNNVFSLVNVFHNIFIFIGIILNKYLSSITITGIGLLLKIIANAFFIFMPNIKIVTLNILICSIGCGISYMPIISEIWKYFPENKGLATSLALSGFGLTELLFEDISDLIINYEKMNINYINGIYSAYINDNFKLYLKKSEIFFSILSIICILFIYPYDKYKKYFGIKDDKRNKNMEDLNNYNNLKKNKIKNNIDKNINEQNKNRKNKGININEYKVSNSPHLMRVKDVNKLKKNNNYINKLTSKFLNKKEKQQINNNKKYAEEDLDFDDIIYNNSGNIKSINNILEKNISESFISLIASYPFVQLTFIFFFTMMLGIIQLSSMINFGFLNGHSEEFLWYNAFLWKITNFLFFPLWGYLFDKFGFKRTYRLIITLEIFICSICYYISNDKIGFILYCFISALVNSGGLAIRPTNFSIIFNNERGAFLFGISCFLTNTFYIFRPLISNLLTDKIYYLIIYLTLTLFSMLGFIILCFYIDEKYISNINNDSYENEIGEEMKNIDFYDDNQNNYFIDNNDDKNGDKEEQQSTSY